ncbi:MAG: hypothetical protein P4L53_05320 [Candidatus Obscuribacterales bacterium]|nr:hypothetical protein [Candidatus Obscuribacterales bacterium]
MLFTPETVVVTSLLTTFVLVLTGFFCGIKYRAGVPQRAAIAFAQLGTPLLVVGGLFLGILSLCSSDCIFYDLGGFAMCLGGLIAFTGYGLSTFPYKDDYASPNRTVDDVPPSWTNPRESMPE